MSERLHDFDLPIWSIIDFFLDLPGSLLVIGALAAAGFAFFSAAS